MNQLITDQNYVKIVGELIRLAKEEILMSVFCARFKARNNYQGSKTILEELSKAQDKKVKVNILLHGGKNYSIIAKWNKASIKTFRNFGLRPKFAVPEVTLHSKFLVIDGNTLVIGSHNLTESSLTRTQEVSVVMEDYIIAQRAKKYFMELWNKAHDQDF